MLNYSTEIAAEQVEITLSSAHNAAKVYVKEKEVHDHLIVNLEAGENRVAIVEAEDGSTKTYTLTIQNNRDDNINPTIPFTDISGHWAEEFILQGVATGIIKGYPDGTFKPENIVTRTQAASFLVRTLGLEADEAAPFKDTQGLDKAMQAEIGAAYKFGIVKGSAGKFNPNEPVTRAHLALMVKRSYELITGEPYAVTEFAPFPDIATYDNEAKTAISILYTFGIVNGSNGKFLPMDVTKRSQSAKIFVNYLDYIKDLPFFITDVEK